MKVLIAALSVLTVCIAQRSPYAGRIAIGYPQIETTTVTTTTSNVLATSINGLASNPTGSIGDRFGVDATTALTTVTTERMPIEANGDRDLIQRLSKLPADNQPFWFLNWKALEQSRAQPQSYNFHQNHFIDFASSPNQQNRF